MLHVAFTKLHQRFSAQLSHEAEQNAIRDVSSRTSRRLIRRTTLSFEPSAAAVAVAAAAASLHAADWTSQVGRRARVVGSQAASTAPSVMEKSCRSYR